MKPIWLHRAVLATAVAAAIAAGPASITIPSISGALTIDGNLDESA